jgi:hypothetical protein
MVSVVGVTTRRLSLGISVCVVIAVAFTLNNAANFQFIGLKRLGLKDEIGKRNTDGHGHDSQTVDIDPSQQESTSQAAVVVDDVPLIADYPPSNVTGGNSSLPHTSDLRVAVDTIDPSQALLQLQFWTILSQLIIRVASAHVETAAFRISAVSELPL